MRKLIKSIIIIFVESAVFFGVFMGILTLVSESNEPIAAVVSHSRKCAVIGVKVLNDGGGVTEAAMATAVCESLLNPQSLGFGGGFFMIVYTKKTDEVDILQARECSPVKSNDEVFNSYEEFSLGIKSACVPTELPGYWRAYERFGGHVPWGRIFQPSIKLLTKGIKITKYLAERLQWYQESIKKDPGMRSVFYNEKTQSVLQEGDVYKNPALLDTLKLVKEKGRRSFGSSGALTMLIVKDTERLGGLLQQIDFEICKPKWEKPIQYKFDKDNKIFFPGFPCNGVVVAFMLNVLKRQYLFSQQNITTWQRMIECLKFGVSYSSYIGDPTYMVNHNDFVEHLLSPELADSVSSMIMDNETFDNLTHYGAPPYYENIDEHGTKIISILASNGDGVILASGLNEAFGSCVMLPTTGIILNNQMLSFNLPRKLRHKVNKTKLINLPMSRVNRLEPFKRPRSSRCPVMVTGDSSVRFMFSVGGGPKIVSTMYLLMTRKLLFKMTLNESFSAKKIYLKIDPLTLVFDEKWKQSDNQVPQGLEKIGHRIFYKNFTYVGTGITNESGSIEAAFSKESSDSGSIEYLY